MLTKSDQVGIFMLAMIRPGDKDKIGCLCGQIV